MNYGLYCAYLGMRARQERLDAIANNIANASTSGFKADQLQYRSAEAAQTAGHETPSPSAAPVADAIPVSAQARLEITRYGRDVGVVTTLATDFSQGPIRETGAPLDLALTGDGFFVVQTARGERYTRAGSFTLDASGQLVTQTGDLVIGGGGPITVPPGTISVGSDGSISVNGHSAGQLKLVQFVNPQAALTKEGNCLFQPSGTEQPNEATSSRVLQGALEASNVNPLTEMVAMMQNTREFESLQHSATTMMNQLGRTIASELGKL